jgi:hypothetical protein
MWNEMDTDPFIKGKRGESQAFGVEVVLSDEAVMLENQQLTVPTPDFLTLSPRYAPVLQASATPLRLSPSFSTRGIGDPGSRSRWTSWLKGLYHRGHVLVLIQKLSARADTWWRLGWQREVELFEQDFVIGLWMGIAA